MSLPYLTAHFNKKDTSSDLTNAIGRIEATLNDALDFRNLDANM